MTWNQEKLNFDQIIDAFPEYIRSQYSIKDITRLWSEYSTELYCAGYIGVNTVSILGFIDWLQQTNRLNIGSKV